ncbi:hypothetical protein JKP88DRAFT_352452 [Tribonema minus]|uniref:NAD(P)-binding domain-containing protein n=1 Tax=Tribonema minus TaxID=303371 RepID=A0A835ZFB8_9STRA|nr:hypothetical protein JKP88DRAFT_352452 [Tribonema minus]
MNAVVFGATGAIGREVVTQLAQGDKWSKVVACVRRPVETTEWVPEGPAAAKIQVKVLDYDDIAGSLPQTSLDNVGTAFYCLGTTRKDAGSASDFVKIDYGYLEQIAPVCKGARVRHFSLVTAAGASASSPFLYMKTKGRCENFVKGLGFALVSIWQPGLLGRGEKARFVERMTAYLVREIPVSTVAKAMVADAEAKAAQEAAPPCTFGNKDMWALAK